MKSYNDLYIRLLSEYQSTTPNIQNPAFLKLQNYFKQLNQQVDDETINGILNTLEDDSDKNIQTEITPEEQEKQNNPDVPEEKPTSPNVSPVMNNPLNPFNKTPQKTM